MTLVRPARFERATFGFEDRSTPDVTPASNATCETPQQALGRLLGAFAAEIGLKCPDLAAVVTAWTGLPEALKAGILAMVKATDKGGR
ncbi:MAG: hypothetical protein IMZ66_12130 [Planctomycetes bacterium]|nr:hypothetical protein [Planctomycetota bacterium]